MPQFRCPGSVRSATPAPRERTCLKCGRSIEIFSDEEKVLCKCGAVVFRDRVPRCVEWCAAAQKCLGHILDVQKIQAEARKRAAAEGNPHFVRDVCELVRNSQKKGL